MAFISKLHASFDSVTGQLRYDRADILNSLGGIDAETHQTSSSSRTERLSRIRKAVAEGSYYVSSARLAQSLMENMGSAKITVFRAGDNATRDQSPWGEVSRRDVAHATFPRLQASESPEDVNDERVGEVEGNRRT